MAPDLMRIDRYGLRLRRASSRATKNAEVPVSSAIFFPAGSAQLALQVARRCINPPAVVGVDPPALSAPSSFSATNTLSQLCTSRLCTSRPIVVVVHRAILRHHLGRRCNDPPWSATDNTAVTRQPIGFFGFADIGAMGNEKEATMPMTHAPYLSEYRDCR